jgi:hypothetical protein
LSILGREEKLDEIRNLPDEIKDPIDLFTEFFNELYEKWSSLLKEFDHMRIEHNAI